MNKVDKFLEDNLSGSNENERQLLTKGFEIGNAFMLINALNYLNKNSNIKTIEELKSLLNDTIETTKYAKDIM